MTPTEVPDVMVPRRPELPVPFVGAAAVAAVVLGVLAVALTPVAVAAVFGAVIALALFAAATYRPIFATYVYIGTLPFIAGIDRGALIPLVRPNEALLVLLLAGAGFGGYLRYCRGDAIRFRLNRLDVPLAAFLVMSTVWPITSLMLRGQPVTSADLAAVLPMCKLVAIYVLVRLTVTAVPQLVRLIRLVVWPGAVVAVIAILQTLQVGPVVSVLSAVWTPDTDTTSITERGSTTLSSPIATGDYIIFSLVLVLCCGARGLLNRRERIVLGVVLAIGVLASGQFSTWISAAVAGVIVLWTYPDLRRKAVRFLPLVPVIFAVGAPALLGRLQGFDVGAPESWQGRWDNLTTFYIPRFHVLNVLLGISPNSVLQAPETWREVIYLEAGYLQLLWIGGIPLLAAFAWLSVAVLRRTGELVNDPGPVGATASALRIAWWFLLVLTVIDPHLTMRGIGDLLFSLLAITTGVLSVGIAPYDGAGLSERAGLSDTAELSDRGSVSDEGGHSV